MMINRKDIIPASSYRYLKVGIGFPTGKMEQGPVREGAIRFYWSLFQLLNKALHLQYHDQPTRVLRLSFEDDFEADDPEDEELEDDLDDEEDEENGFIPLADFFKDEEDPREEEEEGDLKDEFINK